MRWLGAIQAQDHGPATWSVAQRTPGLAAAAVDRAFAEGRFLRTHVLRPTWHFVHPADLRWMLALTAPRVLAADAYHLREVDLDAATLSRAHRTIERALAGGAQLTRAELGERLGERGRRLGHIMMHAELHALVCSGAMRGKQHTYALLDERVPAAPALDRDAALAELVLRYFTGHGPSTLRDLRWWSSLTQAELQRGLEAVGDQLEHAILDGVACWWGDHRAVPKRTAPSVHLLQTYDELVVGYAGSQPVPQPFRVDGKPAGRWRRTLGKGEVLIEVRPDAPPSRAVRRALDAEVARFGAFLGLPARLVVTAP